MEIVTAKKEDLEIIRKITRSTIKSIYPRYYPAEAVEFFLTHHSGDKTAFIQWLGMEK